MGHINCSLASCVLAIVFLMFDAATAAETPEVRIAPKPDWVHTVDWSRSLSSVDPNAGVATRYILTVYQAHPENEETYSHHVREMLNETGVQENGTVTVSFDPSFEELTIHKVNVHREGKERTQLDDGAVKIIQPESRLANDIYDGRYSAVVLLGDLRVGDVVEYSYTHRGTNPVLDGHYSSRLYVRWSVPIERQYYRVRWSKEGSLRWRAHRDAFDPHITKDGDATEFVWEISPQPALILEDRSPSHYEAYSYVELSDFDSWGDVVRWALNLYTSVEDSLTPEMSELVERWENAHSSSAARASAAIRFVQDELRYLGIELGPGSYRPSVPVHTFQRRFGDCKDKAYLLCTFLRAMDIECYPALVNTSIRKSLADRLPSPNAFNHVIVKVRVPGSEVWVDPTRTYQRGKLQNLYLPQYGYALVIRPGNTQLEPVIVPKESTPETRVREDFDIASYDEATSVRIATTYFGGDADGMRMTLSETDRRTLQDDYLNYYAKFYDGIAIHGDLKVEDDEVNNVIKVAEEYRIKDLWSSSGDDQRPTASFYPDSLNSVLTEPRTRLRTMPVELSYPLRKQHEIAVRLPEDWDVSDDQIMVSHEAFSFHCSTRSSDSEIVFFYELETKKDEVRPEEIADYLTKVEEFEESLGNYLERADESKQRQTNDGQVAAADGVNWAMVMTAVCHSVLFAVAMLWLCRTPRFRATSAQTEMKQAPPFRGLLILVGFGVCVSPLKIVASMSEATNAYFSLDIWQEFAMPAGESYHPLIAPLLVMEVIANVSFGIFSLTLIYLFFAKRKLFPSAYIITSLLSLIFLGLDEAIVMKIPILAQAVSREETREIIVAGIGSLIFCPYMVMSERVKSTFIR